MENFKQFSFIFTCIASTNEAGKSFCNESSSLLDKANVIEIASIVIAIVSLLIATVSFLINYIFTQKRLFYDVYTNYITNDNAQKACHMLLKESIKVDEIKNDSESEEHLDQFLMFINTLLGISSSIFIKYSCRRIIKYEIDIIKSNPVVARYAMRKDNNFDNLRKVIKIGATKDE